MQNFTIKHGLRKNLPIGTLYNSQVASIILMVGIAFKLSAAPGMISSYYGSSTLWVFILFSVLELICAVMIFAFSRMSADAFLIATNSLWYKAACLVVFVHLGIKCTFYFCYCASYLTHELFTGAQPFFIYVLLIAPIIYLGAKGTRSIARSCELFAPVFLAVIILNLAFLDTELDIGRNLPIFSVSPVEFFSKFPHYGLWLGDLLPFAFVRIRNKKFPYVTSSISITGVLANIIVMFGVAIYGDALKMVSDLLIHIASFNQLSLEIGRMEWSNLFVILAMSVFSISFLYDGANNASRRAFGSAVPSKIACPAAILCTTIFVTSTQTVTDFAVGTFGYALSITSVAIPLLFLIFALVQKRKMRGLYRCADSEYMPKKVKKPSLPSSEFDGILCSEKGTCKTLATDSPTGGER